MPRDVPIIHYHSPTDTNAPVTLDAGEAAWNVGPVQTKLWVGDGTGNRLVLSTAVADMPLFNLRNYLPLAGGAVTGPTSFTNATAGQDAISVSKSAAGNGMLIDCYGPSIGLRVQAQSGATGNIVNMQNYWTGCGFFVNAAGETTFQSTTSNLAAIPVTINTSTGSIGPAVRVLALSGTGLQVEGGSDYIAKLNHYNSGVGLYVGGTGAVLIANTGTDPDSIPLTVTGQVTTSAALRVTGSPLTVGTPTGPAVTGAGNVNVSGGYYVNGVELTGGGGGVNVSDVAPAGAATGDTWFNENDGRLYIRYQNAWVQV